jgi:hypothetical protein
MLSTPFSAGWRNRMELITRSDDERLDIIAEDQENTDTNLPERRLLILSLRAALEEIERLTGREEDVGRVVSDIVTKRDATIADICASLEEKERQLCGAREALEKFRSAGMGGGSSFCEMTELFNSIVDSLSLSSPCPHEAEVKRLTEYADRIHATTGIEITRLNTRIGRLKSEGVVALCVCLNSENPAPDCPCVVCTVRRAEARIRELEEAVEWACENAPAGENAYVAGIRRRAGRKGE